MDKHRRAVAERKMRNLVEDEETMSSIGARKALSSPIISDVLACKMLLSEGND